MATAPDELEAFYEFATRMRDANPESFSLERAYHAYLNDQWEPRTPLAKRLKELRAEYIASGGKLSTTDEILAEIRENRGSMGD